MHGISRSAGAKDGERLAHCLADVTTSHAQTSSISCRWRRSGTTTAARKAPAPTSEPALQQTEDAPRRQSDGTYWKNVQMRRAIRHGRACQGESDLKRNMGGHRHRRCSDQGKATSPDDQRLLLR